MTLAQRLLVATAILAVFTTAALGYLVREAWRRQEEVHFQENFRGVRDELARELSSELRDLPKQLGALCSSDPFVDSVLLDLRAGTNPDPGRRLAVSLHVPEMMKAFGFDELFLLTGRGEILGAGHADGLVGKRDPELAAKLKRPSTSAIVRAEGANLAVEAHCTHGDDRARVGLIGARQVARLLDEIGRRHQVELSLSAPRSTKDAFVATVAFPELDPRLTVYGVQPKVGLERALRELDTTILLIAAITIGAALLLALLLSRGLARPIVSLSEQVGEVMRGEPKPVKGGGGRELEQLADSFNRTISDLYALRKRLAATERIAARREIARRVAHEIKNPLAPIRAAVETLRRLRARNDAAFDEYFDEATRTVLEEVERITGIVSEFTRFARLPAPSPAPMDLIETARKVVGLHASGSKATIELDSQPCAAIHADRDQIVQVLTNLIQNALDAASGSETPRIVVQVRPLGAERVLLRVSDNGPGVSPEMRQRLFEPYATTKPEGTGLGLAIVERIVVEHGGEIRYDDAAGGGAQFSVTLPVTGPTFLTDAPPSSTPLSLSQKNRFSS